MTRGPKKALPDTYKVGYSKPPSETRFRTGVSGNPGGRPRGMTVGRAKRLALQEAYRPITVREGDAVYLPPGVRHRAVNDSDDWMEHLIVTTRLG